jgi:hypothetical protein
LGLSSVRRLAVLLSAVALAGCAGSSRSFVADQSVRIVSPSPLATVSLPFTVSWKVTAPRPHSFAVFVDRRPIPPGHSLRDLASRQCRFQQTCQPDATYLATIGVYLTDSDVVTVSSLEAIGGTAGSEPHPVHTATIVAIDAEGRRSHDAAWQVEFRG